MLNFRPFFPGNVDDSCGLQSSIVRALQPGLYTLIVEGYYNNEGTYTLTTTCGAVPATVPPGESSGDLTCGSSFTGDTTGAEHVVGAPSGEHWYSLTVSTTQSYTFSTCEGTSYDTRLRLFSGSHLEASGVEIGNVDDACGLQSRIVFPRCCNIPQRSRCTGLAEGLGR